MRSAFARVLVLMLCGGLAACGFRLREEVRLPERLSELRVAGVDPLSPLGLELESALARAGARIVRDPQQAAAALRIEALQERRTPLTVDAAGRAQEYEIVQSAEVSLLDPDGAIVMPVQRIELRRDYLFDTAQAQGTTNEEELMRAELQRELVLAILRRIDSALR
jgi:LPS-assembly lipoprotein